MSRQVELGILVTAKNLASRALGQVKGDVNSIESAGKRAGSNLGRNLAVGGAIAAGAIAANVKAGVDSLVELERVNNLTAAALESTGNKAKQSVEGIRARSEAMEQMSGVDDKVIQNAQNLLLTFANINDDAFDPTLEAAVNLNAALGGGDEGLQGTLLQVAKAVNDPVRGMTALRRVGVSFTDSQVEQVKAMVEANDLMGAQAIVLGELETQFGGAAAAANKGAGGAQKRFADAIEDIQMSLATGFLPLIERVSEKMSSLVADPAFLAGVQGFGETLAGAFEAALNFAETIPWDTVGQALSTAGSGAKMAMDAFLSAPAWLQTAILTGWGLNKLTGGALGSLIGAVGQGIIKGVMNMNAGVVNINAGAVKGGPGGGVPTPGGKGGGFVGGLAGGLAVGAGVAAAGVAAVEVGNFMDMRTQAMGGLQSTLDDMPRKTGAQIDESIARIEGVIAEERPLLDGILFNTNVKPQLDAELAQLKEQKAAIGRTTAAARDAIPWAQRNVASSNKTAAMVQAQSGRLAAIEGVGRSQVGKLGTISAIESGNSAKLSAIQAKKTSVTAIINTSVNVNLQQWQRAQVSSIRANSNSGGFI